MLVAEHVMNILPQQLLPTLPKEHERTHPRGYLACLDPMREINILHLSSCQYLSYIDIIVPMSSEDPPYGSISC